MLEDQRGPPTWRLHTKLCNFVRNISTNISALGRRTHLKLGELSYLFIVYNITIFWLCPLHTFWFYFLLRDSAHTLLKFSLAARLRGHKQRKLNDHVYEYLLFVSSKPHYCNFRLCVEIGTVSSNGGAKTRRKTWREQQKTKFVFW